MLLGDLRAGTHGTVDDFTLMKRVNQDLGAGLNLTEDQFRTLSDAAFALSKTYNIDVTEALDKMSDAMVKGRAKGLELLTGKIDLKSAEQAYADSLEGTGRQLDAEGKLELDRETIFNAVVAALDRTAAQQDSLKDKTQQVEAAWHNFENELGRTLANSPVLAAGFDALKNSLVNAFGNDSETLIKRIATAVDETAILVVDFGLAVVGVANSVHTGWDFLASVILGGAVSIGGALSLIMEGITLAAETYNLMMPNTVSQQQINSLQRVRDQVELSTVSMTALLTKTNKGIMGHSAFNTTLDTLGGTLFQTRDALVAAKDAMDKHTAATTTNTGAAKTNAETTDQQTKNEKAQNAQRVISTAYTKQYVDAWKTLDTVGQDYTATIAAMNPKLVEQIEYYLQAGASLSTLAAAYPQVSAAQMKALDDMAKATKKYSDAWAELSTQGENYQATVDAMDPKLVQEIGYFIQAGASLKTLAAAYPEVSAAQIKAIDDVQKKATAAALEMTKIWTEYDELVASGSQTAYEKAEAAIDKWYADDVAKHVASKTDTAEYYAAVTALDTAKYAALAQNRLNDDQDSKAYREKQAHADAEAYQFALDHTDQFTQAHIQKLADAADKSARAAAAFGTSWGDAADQAAASVDKVTAAVDGVTAGLHALGQAGALDEQQALSTVTANVNASGIGQMMRMGTTSVATMNAYEAANEQGMAALGYSVAPRASGGPVSAGTPYVVGEQGPELFVPASGGTILPNGAGGGGLALTVNITQPLGTPSAIASAVSAALTDALRRGGMRLPVQ